MDPILNGSCYPPNQQPKFCVAVFFLDAETGNMVVESRPLGQAGIGGQDVWMCLSKN